MREGILTGLHVAAIPGATILTMFVFPTPAEAQVQFFTDEATWKAGRFVEVFPTESAQIGLADEVDSPPGGNAFGLGGPSATPTFSGLSNTDPFVASVCSVSDGQDCDTKGAIVLQQAFAAMGPGVAPQNDAVLAG